MKRTWKNFRLDKNKLYQRIGQAVVYTSGWALGVAFFYWAFLQRINVLGGKEMEEKIERQIQEIYESNGMERLFKENAPYVVKIIRVLKGLTTNSANQILNEVAYILLKISKLPF